MACKAGRYKTSTPQGIFIVTPSLEVCPTKVKEAPSPHEVRLTPLTPTQYFLSRGSLQPKQMQQGSNMNALMEKTCRNM